MDARLEIAVSRQDGRGDDIMLKNRFLDRGRQGTGITDAGGAPVTDQVESQLAEIRLQTGFLKIIGHHPGSGCQ